MLNKQYLERYAQMFSSGQKDGAYSMSAAAIQKEKDEDVRWDAFYEAVFINPSKPTDDPLVIFYRNNYKFLDFLENKS